LIFLKNDLKRYRLYIKTKMISTVQEKQKVVFEKLYPDAGRLDTCIKDFESLAKMTLEEMEKIPKSLRGNLLNKHFFFHYALDIKTYKQSFTYFELINKFLYTTYSNDDEKMNAIVPSVLSTRVSYDKLLHHYERQFNEYNEKVAKGSRCEELTPEKAVLHFVRFWGKSCVALFKPYIAKMIYLKNDSKSIIDPFAGWGGRMMGAMAIEGVRYTGFDTNIDLKKPYAEMITRMKWKDRVKILFKDSSTVDFSKYEYDTIFTSPPYRLEFYAHEDRKENKNVWYEQVILKTFTNAWNNLPVGGKMIINVNKELYNKLVKTFGEAFEQIDIQNSHARRNAFQKAKNPSVEYAYVWVKNPAQIEIVFDDEEVEEEIDLENFECFQDE